MFICLFVCLFVCWPVCFLFKSSWNSHRNIPWKFHEDPTWFGWDIWDLKNDYLFVCLFVCLMIDLFVSYFFILGHPQEVTLKISWISNLIWLRYLGSLKMFIYFCLFIFYGFVYLFFFSLFYPRGQMMRTSSCCEGECCCAPHLGPHCHISVFWSLSSYLCLLAFLSVLMRPWSRLCRVDAAIHKEVQ